MVWFWMVISPLQLDSDSHVPLYRQLFAYYSALIQKGELARGERLPATRELAGSLGLNRATVAAAYELLEQEGWITGHVGRGSFVSGPSVPADSLDWERLLRSDIARQNPAPSAGPAAISFATSRPSEDLFPLEDLRTSCREVMAGPDFAHIL